MLKDCNLDFPRIASKRGIDEGQNNINSLAARNNNTLPKAVIMAHTHTHTNAHIGTNIGNAYTTVLTYMSTYVRTDKG